MPPLFLWMMYLALVLTLATLAWSVRQFVLDIRAGQKLVRLLTRLDEYRPLLDALLLRVQQHGGRLTFSEHEAIDLREQVHRAVAHLPPADQKRVQQSLYGPTVAEREAYLRSVLSASIWSQRQHA
jgi:hypothetical protein